MSTPIWEGPESVDVSGETAGWTFVGDAAIEESLVPHGIDPAVIRIRGDGATSTPRVRMSLMPVQPRDVIEHGGWVYRKTGAADNISGYKLIFFDASGGSESTVENRFSARTEGVWGAYNLRRFRVPPTGVAYCALEFYLSGTPVAADEYLFDDFFLRVAPAPQLLTRRTTTLAGPAAATAEVSTNVDLDLGPGSTDPPPMPILWVEISGVRHPLPYTEFQSVSDANPGRISVRFTGSVNQQAGANPTRVTFTIRQADGVNRSGTTYTFGMALYDPGADS